MRIFEKTKEKAAAHWNLWFEKIVLRFYVDRNYLEKAMINFLYSHCHVKCSDTNSVYVSIIYPFLLRRTEYGIENFTCFLLHSTKRKISVVISYRANVKFIRSALSKRNKKISWLWMECVVALLRYHDFLIMHRSFAKIALKKSHVRTERSKSSFNVSRIRTYCVAIVSSCQR